MEDNFRNVLIILSAIVIIAIFIHGLWTIRKQKNPYKLKASKGKVAPLTRDFDNSGFDQDGVSQVKPIKAEEKHNDGNLSQSQIIKNRSFLAKTSELKVPSIKPSDTSASSIQAPTNISDDSQTAKEKLTELDDSVESDWFKDDLIEQADDDLESQNSHFTKAELGDELTPTVNHAVSDKKKGEPEVTIEIEPLYEQPVIQAKPTRSPIKKTKKQLTKAELKRDQIEIDFDNQLAGVTQEQAPEPEKLKAKIEPKIEPQVIILSVVMPANQQMLGAALLPSLLTLGLKYGEMNIFHRHEDNAGNGKVTFSLANIVNPGTFDLDSMENFATRGVSLFMTLPNAGDSFAVFEQMLNAAKQLAQEFNAQVLDDKRNVLTKQSEQHYVSQIREFDRKSRIGLV